MNLATSYEGYHFGRLPAWDSRNGDHLMRSVLSDAPLAAYPLERFWRVPRILDQGPTPQCVGHAGRHDLEATPIPVPYNVGPDASRLYAEAQARDGIKGAHSGTTLLALGKACVDMALWERYVWAASIEDVLKWLLQWGPVCIGIGWTSGMMQPDSRGVIRPTGSVVGGHAVTLRGVHQPSGYVLGVNSWGPWGPFAGHFWIFARDLASLLFERGGEAMSPTEPGMV